MRKLLLLGGSAQQIPAVEYANRRGYYTVLCDYLPDNPGQYYADRFYCVSTTDKEAILDVAQKEKVDGVVAYASDPAAPTAAYVGEKMGLPTNPYKSVELLANKDKFRSFLAGNGFNTPRAQAYSCVDNAVKEIEQFKFPVIIKPVDSCGSKGVSRLTNALDLKDKFKNALSFSRCKRVIIEEFVEKAGYQIAGDGFSVNGQLVFRCFANDHFNTGDTNPFVPISASFPYHMPKVTHDRIHAEIQRLFDLLGVKTGAYNFDIRLNEDGDIYLMEIGPRNGGNFIPQVIRYATGVDMIDYTLRAATGENCNDIRMVEPKGFWSYYAVHSLREGILRKIQIDNRVEANNIVESHFNHKIGDYVQAFTQANTNLGILIMRFTSMEKMLYMMDNADQWIQVVVS